MTNIPSASAYYRTPTPQQITLEVAMRTQGEIEAVICEGISRFEQDYMGWGPKEIFVLFQRIWHKTLSKLSNSFLAC
jgi:hypothetical protein